MESLINIIIGTKKPTVEWIQFCIELSIYCNKNEDILNFIMSSKNESESGEGVFAK